MEKPGRKRRSLLESFSAFRDSSSGKHKKEKVQERSGFQSSTVTLAAFYEGRSREQLVPPSEEYEDSVEEMADALLNDTTLEQPKIDPGRRLSQIGLTLGNSGISTPRTIEDDNSDTRHNRNNNKDLPQLPAFIFNGDDAWAMRTSPVVTAAGNSNLTRFSMDVPPTPPAKTEYSHNRKGSAPAIPRRSSKRKSSRSKSNITSPQKPNGGHVRGSSSKNKLSKSFSTPMVMNVSAPVNQSEATSSSVNAQDINGKIAKMLQATQALKGSSSESALYQGPMVPSKKRRIKDNRVLVRVKTVFNHQMQSRNGKRPHDPVRDDRLLDPSVNNAAEVVPELISPAQMRINEGNNFEKSKITKMTGNGKIRRKPVATDGKSLGSRQSKDKGDKDPFRDSPSSDGTRRSPSSFEHKLLEEISSEHTGSGSPSLPRLPRSISTLPGIRKCIPSTLAYDSDFDTLFSSSPAAQSTPRMRLEPAFENGKKTLKSVPADSLSLFDPDSSTTSPGSRMDVDVEPVVEITETEDFTPERATRGTPRRASKLGYQEGFPVHTRGKKHPSPSKLELETMEQHLADYFTRDRKHGEDALRAEQLPPSYVLAPRDPNISIADRDSKHSDKMPEVPPKLEFSRVHNSMPNLARTSKQRFSLNNITFNARRDSRLSERHSKSGFDMENYSDMDIDELQTNDPVYHIGRIKA
ncbi:hypothetical protein GLAREA_10231 [Glarea lozoyensis ATCC 20868]|uniref:Uncharacterized protein n=1 Tax=Glarea lozoyensis (strain ATCC 20868 / MF5171) TaxID=1116229 RepID=S3D7Q1_GLAL2|nr:uncharacterized protein GLAREA_10231 [Glarea lozoyensis ATCC 20868]EPE34537.1 hypothetical protein GLAREA_10231 [Glarea lozoyensis ATCC 20868]